MQENKYLPATFVLVQFLSLFLIATTGSIWPSNNFLLAIELFGLGLGVWAILAMGTGNFNITPNIKANSEFIVSGPYKYIRHPMYSSLLLATLPLIINSMSVFRTTVWLVLLIDLLLKLNYEEKLLIDAVQDYSKYRKATFRIVPFLY